MNILKGCALPNQIMKDITMQSIIGGNLQIKKGIF